MCEIRRHIQDAITGIEVNMPEHAIAHALIAIAMILVKGDNNVEEKTNKIS